MTIYKRGTKKLIECRNRKILLQRTPEEIVRQKVVDFLLDEMGVPEECISLEFPLNTIKSTSNMRADIIVWKIDSNQKKYPFLVLEIKASHISLTEETLVQVEKYNRILKAKYVGVSNGKETQFYECSEDGLKLLTTDFYTYKNLISGEVHYQQVVRMRRLPYELISYKKYMDFIKGTEYIGEGTQSELHTLIAELQNYILCGDINPTGRFNHKIIKDYSYGIFNSGNPSGGNFAGYYRSFLVQSPKENYTIFRIGIFGTPSLQNDPVYGNRNGNTYLTVAVEMGGISTNVLQLNLDKFLVENVVDGSYDIFHSGRRNGFKNEDVIQSVIQNEPKLLLDGKIYLGKLPIGRSISETEGSDMIERLLAYAACRNMMKKKKRRFQNKKIIKL
ncbi:hypothetical protein JOD03_000968 [Chryseomicrobium aureum]|uniref:type I restriction enzyme HsdR N-terminal domain-containing protein n=1 Tax=Chryseomicrobium aureum TaxID=1441723 RepID=UPI0019572186|nr:type I restriction enzyme HsdR N-terminal domain-containing protein [Chryseomicrobium aureum]MBM7706066.1 hypothetical protein [Chryseomicrobium aureum]